MLDLAAADTMSAQEVMSAREIAGGGDTVLGTTATTDSIALGTSLTGYINTTGDHDWYSVTLTAGVTYLFNLVGSGAPALSLAYLYVHDSSGLALTYGDFSQVVFVAPTSGTYYLDAAAFGDFNAGQYTLSAAVSPDFVAGGVSTTATVAVGSSVTGRIDTSNDQDWYAVTLTAGVSYLFNVAASGGSSIYPSMYLHNAAGAIVGGGSQQLGFDVTTTGIYYLDVSSYSVGQFTLTAAISPDLISANTNTTGSITVGSSRTGAIDYSNDHDWYAVTLTAGVNYVFNATATGAASGATNLQLFSATGAGLASGGSQLGFDATTTGTYYVDITSYYTGQFTLTAAVSPDLISANINTTGRVTVGSTVTGTIDLINDHDWYAVTLTAGTSYIFNVAGVGPGIYPSLYLLNATGSYVTFAIQLGCNNDGHLLS
jgi:hypothetical protein